MLLGAKLNTRDRKMGLVHNSIEAFGGTEKSGFSDAAGGGEVVIVRTSQLVPRFSGKGHGELGL